MNRSSFRLVSRLVLGAAVLLSMAAWAGEYGDITFERKSATGMDDTPAAVFSHWVHRMQYKCMACHDDLFKMKAGSNPVTMDSMSEGKWCGACHNGKAAFESNFDTCPRCHHK
jgi:c(7)-type cytochrome triheme protein